MITVTEEHKCVYQLSLITMQQAPLFLSLVHIHALTDVSFSFQYRQNVIPFENDDDEDMRITQNKVFRMTWK